MSEKENDSIINEKIAKYLDWQSQVTGWFCSKDGGVSGWLFCDLIEECEEKLKTISQTDWRHGSTIHPLMSVPPNYCGDLNLMYELEKVIEEKKLAFIYNFNLGRNGGNNYEWSKIHATARQRAEAFLLTVNYCKS